MMAEIAKGIIAFSSLWCLINIAYYLKCIADELKKWNDELTK